MAQEKVRITDLPRMKAAATPITMLTAYDYPFARIFDQAGIDISVIFPSHATSYCVLRDVAFESALHRAHHRYMSNYCAEAGGRLRWVAIATMRDIRTSVLDGI